MSNECVLPTHPRTGLRALGFTSRGPVWPVMGGDDSDDAAAQAAAAASAGSDWKPPASQADLDRIIQQRLARETAKYAGFDDIKAKADQFDVLAAASKTDMEKAVETAKAEAAESVRAEATPRIVRAEFKAAAKGVLTAEQLEAVLEDYNPKNYLDDKGDVDEAKIAARVAKFATTPQGGQGSQSHRTVDLGQGNRAGVKATARELGAAEAARRFGKK